MFVYLEQKNIDKIKYIGYNLGEISVDKRLVSYIQ